MINLVALYHEMIPIDLLQIVYSEINLKGTFVYTHSDFRGAKNLLEKGIFDVKPFITDVYPIEEAAEVFEKIYRRDNGLKTLIEIVS